MHKFLFLILMERIFYGLTLDKQNEAQDSHFFCAVCGLSPVFTQQYASDIYWPSLCKMLCLLFLRIQGWIHYYTKLNHLKNLHGYRILHKALLH